MRDQNVAPVASIGGCLTLTVRSADHPAQAFFCAAGVDDVDLVVRALQYWLTNRREFPKPADIAAIAPTCTGGVTYQFLEDDRPRHICCPSCRVALDEIHQTVTGGAPLRVVPGQ